MQQVLRLKIYNVLSMLSIVQNICEVSKQNEACPQTLIQVIFCLYWSQLHMYQYQSVSSVHRNPCMATKGLRHGQI